MANFDQLKQSVSALIRTNGAEEITGQIMQDVLLTIINSISGGYMFGGVAQHSGNVGNPDYNVFYLAGSGAYTGYGDAINIPNGCYGVFRYNGSWTQEVVDIGVHLTGTIREGETNGVTGDVINTALQQLFNNVMNILDTLKFTYNTPSAQQATKAMLDVIVTPTGGASHVLTTLTLVSATAAAAGLMSAEDKRKVDRMLTDFRSLSFSDTTTVDDQATKIVQTLSATLGENPEAITTMTFLAATASKAGLLSAADKAKLDAMWSSGYQFVGIATPGTTPISTTSKIFYIATEAGTYFNAVTVTQGINILSWNGSAWSAVQVVGIDDEPTSGSSNLVESGGVYKEIDEINTSLGKISTSISLSGSHYGYIIDNNGDLVEIEDGYYSVPVYLYKGESVFLKARNSQYVGAVCKTDENETAYEVVKTGTGLGSVVPMQIVSYLVKDTGYYAFSYVGDVELHKVSLETTENIEHINGLLRKAIPIFKSVGTATTLDNLQEVYIYDKFFASVTKNVTVLCYQNALYLIGTKNDDSTEPTWWAKTSVLTGGENGKVYPVVFTDEGGTPAEAQAGDTIGYVVFSDVDTFAGTPVTSGYHPLNLDFISNIRLCPIIATYLSDYFNEKIKQIDVVSETLGISIEEINIQIDKTDKCVRETGEVIDFQQSYISYPVFFTKGTSIQFKARSSRFVGAISKTDISGTSYTPVAIGIGSGSIVPMQTIAYTINEDGYYAFCWFGIEKTCNIITDNTVNIQKYNLLAMFDNITYCGDSLTYSQVSTSPASYRAAKKIYPNIIAGLCGNNAIVLAHPGDTAKRWWDNFSSQLVSRTNNLYMVYLGTNQGLTDTIDEDCPVSGGIDDYADTNTGCYGKLLKKIQELGDKAILIKITPEYSHSAVTNDVIEQFGERFNMPVVKNDRINEIIYRYYPDGSGYDKVHLNDLGYSYFANRLIRDIAEMPYNMYERLVVTEE